MKNKHWKIDFSNGEAAEHVSGSCVHLPDFDILLECGFSQSNSIQRDYRDNNAKFKFSVKELKYIFLSHNHLDHTGRVPLLYKRGCNAQIIVSVGSKAILRNMWEDSVKINEREAMLMSRQTQKDYEPIYGPEDVENALNHVVEFSVGQTFYLDDNISFRLTYSGHIRYAVQVELFLSKDNIKKKLVYTGDLGNYLLPKRFTESFNAIEKCDVLIGETTYGDKTRTKANSKLRKKDLEKLKTVIKQFCVDSNNKILIPCFALDRTPEMYMTVKEILKENWWDVPVLIDSPLAIKQLEIYCQEEEQLNYLAHSPKTYLCSDYKTSTLFQKVEGPMIIISSSGMLNAGRVLQHLPRILSNPHNCILFCGYATEGTLAWEIKHGRKRFLEINGKKVPNKAHIVMLNSFSSHMQYDELLDYYSSVNCERIYLVHGQMDSKVTFSKELKKELEKKNKTTQVICVNKGTDGKI